MKILGYIFSIGYLLCASLCGCGGGDDYDYIDYQGDIPDLISVENDSNTLQVGDTLWVNSSVPNMITTNQGEQININLLTGNDRGNFNFKLLKFGGFERPSVISLSEDELIDETGNAVVSQYNASRIEVFMPFRTNEFALRFGIILKEEGLFSLTEYNGDPVQFYFSDVLYEDNTIENITINSSFKDSEFLSEYRFTVE